MQSTADRVASGALVFTVFAGLVAYRAVPSRWVTLVINMLSAAWLIGAIAYAIFA